MAAKKSSKRNNSILAFLLAGVLMLAAWAWHTNSEEPAALAAGEIAVHFIDVGQGDCALVAAQGRYMLIDGGERGNEDRVVKYLREQGVERLDYVVATHPHSDHIGGMADIIIRMEIGDMLMPNVQHNTQTFENMLDAIIARNVPVYSPTPGDTFMLGDALVTVLAPFRLTKVT